MRKERNEMDMHGIWIWENASPEKDEYAEFFAPFDWRGGRAVLRISADSNYTAYVNGSLCAFGQYADFPYWKTAEEIDITAWVREGRNELRVLVWYYGIEHCCTYFPGKAGVIFEVLGEDTVLCRSGEDTLCRPDAHYVSHRCKKITGQLGYGYAYDANPTEHPLHGASATGFSAPLHERPIERLELWDAAKETLLKNENNTHFLLDLGREEVGFLTLSLFSERKQTILIAYGEHILDGGVRRQIGNRDFSVEYIAKPGENEFLNTFRRFGCRYLELFCEAPIILHRASIRPTVYPVTELPFDAGTPERQKIYDVSVRTLRLCMHEHYEDCPWREQALYAMDSRNQILAGYEAFGETRYPRAALALLARDRTPTGLLSITCPSGWDEPIPSFSLHYFTEVLEYTEYTGDLTLAAEVWGKLCSVMQVFLDHIREDGLIWNFREKGCWNFYEWAPGLTGRYDTAAEDRCDLILNAMLILAVEQFAKLAARTGNLLPFDADAVLRGLRNAAVRAFGDGTGAYPDRIGGDTASELGNAFAILAGILPEARAVPLLDAIADGTSRLTPITLSMKCFLYDAMLAVNAGAYTPFILSDIDRTYGAMLAQGATSFWETEKGAEDFGGAGSLCHGWSAMPAYYYRRLLGKRA